MVGDEDGSVQTHIPDFMLLRNYGDTPKELRRYDLATLRQCAKALAGVDDGNIICKCSRDRLIGHGMVERRISADGYARSFATEYGLAVVRANASCVDGSEGRR